MLISKMTALPVLTAFATALTLSACGPMKTMDEMGKTTAKMGDTTEKMSGQMGETNAGMGKQLESSGRLEGGMHQTVVISGHLEERTDSLYEDLRQGNSLTIRSQRLDNMGNVSAPEAKIR